MWFFLKSTHAFGLSGEQMLVDREDHRRQVHAAVAAGLAAGCVQPIHGAACSLHTATALGSALR